MSKTIEEIRATFEQAQTEGEALFAHITSGPTSTIDGVYKLVDVTLHPTDEGGYHIEDQERGEGSRFRIASISLLPKEARLDAEPTTITFKTEIPAAGQTMGVCELGKKYTFHDLARVKEGEMLPPNFGTTITGAAAAR